MRKLVAVLSLALLVIFTTAAKAQSVEFTPFANYTFSMSENPAMNQTIGGGAVLTVVLHEYTEANTRIVLEADAVRSLVRANADPSVNIAKEIPVSARIGVRGNLSTGIELGLTAGYARSDVRHWNDSQAGFVVDPQLIFKTSPHTAVRLDGVYTGYGLNSDATTDQDKLEVRVGLSIR